jgi:hypothetical protein
LVRAGVDRDVAKRISGHKTDSMFARYNVTDTRDQIVAFERLEKHLAKAPKKSNVATKRYSGRVASRGDAASKALPTFRHVLEKRLREKNVLDPVYRQVNHVLQILNGFHFPFANVVRRKPSYFSSKIHSGSSNGSRSRESGIGLKRCGDTRG